MSKEDQGVSIGVTKFGVSPAQEKKALRMWYAGEKRDDIYSRVGISHHVLDRLIAAHEGKFS